MSPWQTLLKIEEYLTARNMASRVKETVNKVLGRDSPNNDKHDITFTCETGRVFRILYGYGYYGSSSYYGAEFKELDSFLVQALNENKNSIFLRAVELAQEVARKRCEEARSEAQEVISTIENTPPPPKS